jgi:hypothetical protein
VVKDWEREGGARNRVLISSLLNIRAFH